MLAAVVAVVTLVALARARGAGERAGDGAVADALARLVEKVGAIERVFSDKQVRGAFGEARMEAIVRDGLPRGAYRFQPRLASGARPDCLIRLPGGGPGLVVDAKFPLEGWRQLEAARAAGEGRAVREAEQQMRRDVSRHVRAVAETYLVPGETLPVALLFVPAEGVFATIHETFPDLVERAHRARVVIVSPTLMALAVLLVGVLLRDVKVAEAARQVRAEVDAAADEAAALADASEALSARLSAAAGELASLGALSARLKARGARLERLDFESGSPERAAAPPR